MSVEAYIPYDLRERLAEQIKVIDKMMLDAVVAERERCADEIYRLQIENDRLKETDAYKAVVAERERCERVIGGLMYESYDIAPIECLSRALAAIRMGE